jgi:transposase
VQNERDEISKIVTSSQPRPAGTRHGIPGYGWTLKKLRRWVETKLERRVTRNTLRTILKAAGLRWKKCKKLLGKADPAKRAAFVQQFQQLYERLCAGAIRLVFIDEAHVHQDLDLGYTWAPANQPAWRKSSSPPLSARLNWYGAFDFSEGRCFLWQNGKCNGEHTAQFLERLSAWLAEEERPVIVIWDGAPWHRAKLVQQKAQQLGMQLFHLPGYSPDLNPVERLWQWLREDVTQLFCHPSLHALLLDCLAFLERINLDPELILKRLWPKFDLHPVYEKLLVSI